MDLKERLLGRLDASGECWLWTGAVTTGGYGRIVVDGRVALTHRVAYEVLVGPIPAGMCVCHHCDTPPCARPDHLFLGTRADNNVDRHRKDRDAHLVGVLNGRSRLTPTSVAEIRRLSETEGHTQQALAERFGVSRRNVSFIVRRASWA